MRACTWCTMAPMVPMASMHPCVRASGRAGGQAVTQATGQAGRPAGGQAGRRAGGRAFGQVLVAAHADMNDPQGRAPRGRGVGGGALLNTKRHQMPPPIGAPQLADGGVRPSPRRLRNAHELRHASRGSASTDSCRAYSGRSRRRKGIGRVRTKRARPVPTHRRFPPERARSESLEVEPCDAIRNSRALRKAPQGKDGRIRRPAEAHQLAVRGDATWVLNVSRRLARERSGDGFAMSAPRPS